MDKLIVKNLVTTELKTNNLFNMKGSIIINGNLVLGELSSSEMNLNSNSFIIQG